MKQLMIAAALIGMVGLVSADGRDLDRARGELSDLLTMPMVVDNCDCEEGSEDPRLKIRKTVEPEGPYEVGDEIWITVTIENDSPYPACGVCYELELPDNWEEIDDICDNRFVLLEDLACTCELAPYEESVHMFHAIAVEPGCADCKAIAFAGHSPECTNSFAPSEGECEPISMVMKKKPLNVCSIMGTNGVDVLVGTSGDDVICGLGGNDNIEGLGGDDCILGGGGSDSVDGDAGNDMIFGEGGRDFLRGNGGHDFIDGGDGKDRMDGNGGQDTLRGGNGADWLDGGGGSDDLRGQKGNDKLLGGPGGDDLRGGDGNDQISGGPGNDTVDGGDGNQDECDAQGGTETNCEL